MINFVNSPDLYGFVKDLSGWLMPIGAFVLGNATKGGANQAKLDALGTKVESISKQVQDNTVTITTHTALIEQSVLTARDLISEAKESNRLLWRIAEKVGLAGK